MHISATVLARALQADLEKHIDVQLPSWAPDSNPTEVACYALKRSLLKKFLEADEPSKEACLRGQEKFLNVNKRCASWVIPYETSLDEMLVGGVKDALYRFWYTGNGGPSPIVANFMDLYEAGRSGPGSSIKARSTDLYTKMYDSPLSYTRDLLYVWERCVSKNPVSADAEQLRMTVHGTQQVECNNLSFVNKTVTIARTICTEPSINMWFQKGMGVLMNEQLIAHWNIDFSKQPDINAAMARVGSVNGSLSTIDLESASDSLGVKVMKEILPRSMFDWLMILRTPSTRLPNQEVVALNMISTQGNGFNSPFQTIVFMAVIQSVYHSLGLPMKGRGPAHERNYGCFGDDLIVDKSAFPRVSRLLHLLGFVVNKDKSFVEGRFRESCGADYFEGVNVRGVYIEGLKTLQDRFVAINTLMRWSTKTGVFLPTTITCLLKGLNRPYRYFVPPDEDDAAGIHCTAELAMRNTKRLTRVVGHMMYEAYVPRDWVFYIIRDHMWTTKGQVNRSFNPHGLEIAALAGDMASVLLYREVDGTGHWGYKISIRQSKILYTTKHRITPCWDYLPPRPLEYLGCSRSRRFVDACERNLVGCVFWSGVS